MATTPLTYRWLITARTPIAFLTTAEQLRLLLRKDEKVLRRCPRCAEAGRDRAGRRLMINVVDPHDVSCIARCTYNQIREAYLRMKGGAACPN